VGRESVRFGFSFTVPFGNRDRWTRIIRPVTPTVRAISPSRLEIEEGAIHPAEHVVQVGGVVELWNLDRLPHRMSVGEGGSAVAELDPGEGFRFVFDRTGRYRLTCSDHPGVAAVVVVRE
jgi:plastocyanin